ncbi:MAG: YqaA family protein [Victivallaceae bacterium]
MTALLLLGLSAFLAATIIPFSSEVALAGALSTGVDPTAAVLTATIGNSLGSICTFYLGYWGKLSYLERYCRISESQILAIQSKINRYGAWAAVGCFLPLIGDVLAVGLGFFKYNPRRFICLMTLGKLCRYLLCLGAYYSSLKCLKMLAQFIQ